MIHGDSTLPLKQLYIDGDSANIKQEKWDKTKPKKTYLNKIPALSSIMSLKPLEMKCHPKLLT